MVESWKQQEMPHFWLATQASFGKSYSRVPRYVIPPKLLPKTFMRWNSYRGAALPVTHFGRLLAYYYLYRRKIYAKLVYMWGLAISDLWPVLHGTRASICLVQVATSLNTLIAAVTRHQPYLCIHWILVRRRGISMRQLMRTPMP